MLDLADPRLMPGSYSRRENCLVMVLTATDEVIELEDARTGHIYRYSPGEFLAKYSLVRPDQGTP